MTKPINIQKTAKKELDDIKEQIISSAYESSIFYIRQKNIVCMFFILLGNRKYFHNVCSNRVSSISDS